MRFAVLGAGGWGTAVARLLANEGHKTSLWARDPERAHQIDATRCNERYLPGVSLPDTLHVTANLHEVLEVEHWVFAVPSFGMAALIHRLQAEGADCRVAVNLAKGIDRDTHYTMSELVEKAFPSAKVYTLSGPSHAEEVGRDMPTAVVLAGHDLEVGRQLQHAISTPRFRVYLSGDLRGVEWCSTIKNIIAVATGVSDGLGYGDNSRGALITRGLAELMRFGDVVGVSNTTLFGLSGLGDLVATCTSEHSRNRGVGVRLGQGEPLEDILTDMTMVAEGVFATGIIHEIAEEREIEMPITHAVYRLLQGNADPLSLVNEIMTRTPKREDT